MNREFQVHKLNTTGFEKAESLANHFDDLLEKLKTIVPEGREFSIVKTKLEEACFFAKKGITTKQENLVT